MTEGTEAPKPEPFASSAFPDPSAGPPSDRGRLVQDAVNAWVAQLVDRTARNPLLHFKHLRRGTLDLSECKIEHICSLLSGRTLRLSTMFTDPDAHEDAIARCRVISAKARENYEERGLSTLYLGLGLASWNVPSGKPAPKAPVLLAPATLESADAGRQRFELRVDGDLEINETLLNMLHAEHQLKPSVDELLTDPKLDGAIDTPSEFEFALEWLTRQLSELDGFTIERRTVLGNFSYGRLPMVHDLQNSVAALAQHDLVSALAGSKEARECLLTTRADVDISLPDHTSPADEFLVLDADSSQNRAINQVLSGQSLVIKGPPGTGKSQTITNLIASLIARGKTVLFVAEKRAAIDAVLKRLEQVRLGDLVLDLHGGVTNKRALAQSLKTTLETNRLTARPDDSEMHHRLEARRTDLNEWDEALHGVRAPWGVSLFQAYERLAAVGGDETSFVLFQPPVLKNLLGATIDNTRDLLRDYVALGGLAVSTESSWAGSPITTPEEVSRAKELLASLPTDVRDLAPRIESASAECSMCPPTSIADWAAYMDLWSRAERVLTVFKPGIFELDLTEACQRLTPLGAGVAARIGASLSDGQYRHARTTIKEQLNDGSRVRGQALHAAVMEAAELHAAWRDRSDSLPSFPTDLESLIGTYGQLVESMHELDTLAAVALEATPPAATLDLIHELDGDRRTLERLPDLVERRAALESEGIGPLLSSLPGTTGADVAVDAFDRSLWLSVVEEIKKTDRRIREFDGDLQTVKTREFCVADRDQIESGGRRVRRLAAEHARNAADDSPDQADDISRESAKKSRHKPLRDLFQNSPDVLLGVKPCWVMSPLVVSQVLPNDRPYFDVVVFDEASQVRPAEAIPSIARGRQLVVAGDEKQLPPSAFFDTGSVAVEDDDNETEAEANSGLSIATADIESILEGLLPHLAWQSLDWHYRSQDERLISFSNAMFYGKSLVTFPGAGGPDALLHELVEWIPSPDDVTGTNRREVDRVVELIIRHAEERPEETLGVIAMGIKHANHIGAALRAGLKDREDLNDFFNEHKAERFFVKNLERVQGDERDAIILTVGYGRSPEGRMRYNFGPINQSGGERRLNVAITRARCRMTVVSSFGSADMDPERTKSEGADLLRRYIQFAESGGEHLDTAARSSDPLNAFELDIKAELDRAGIPVVCQHGVSRYRLDFAAQHPQEPGRFVLAIEADGATYHSSPTARDRDRLRQEHLERLGWRFHRIWSQDWFTDRLGQIKRVEQAYADAVRAADSDRPPSPEVVPTAEPPRQVVFRPRGPRPPGIFATGRIDDFTHNELVMVVHWIESDTLIRSKSELLAEVMRELGFRRRGAKIVARIERAIDSAREV